MKSFISRTLAALQTSISTQLPRDAVSQCSIDALPKPEVFGADVLNMSALEVLNYTETNPKPENPSRQVTTDLNFCNITVTYTHPGQNDTINVTIWLPLRDWNGRLQAIGGGGYVTGSLYLGAAVHEGYAAASTDGGHSSDTSAVPWALLSPGNVNWNLLQDFAYRALDDLAVIGKSITTSFYASPPKFSYWNGCSTGGRQGLMLAQRFPEHFDGILAKAPAINWATFIPSELWPQQRMNQLGIYPPTCELDAFTAAAIEACDGLDGLVDGVIGAPGLCHFDPYTVVGKSFYCNGTLQHLTSVGATIAQATWTGPIDLSGKSAWFGVNKDASLSTLAGTVETSNGTRKGAPFQIADEWIRLFIAKNESFDTATMTDSEYFSVLRASQQQYESILSTNWADLSEFRNAGGKMITWHGLADDKIPANGSSHYYEQVLTEHPNAADFYRYFEAPGVGHCRGGSGPVPVDAFNALVDWVENGAAPEVLEASSETDHGFLSRPLCQYPLVQRFRGGDPAVASSFECAAGF